MNPFGKIKKHDINEAKNNAMLILLSFFFAIASWFIIAMTIYPSASKTIDQIPLSLDISGTSAAENGLSVIKSSVGNVSVSFDCSRTDYNQLNNETVKAYVDFDNVSTSGSKVLTIKVQSTNGAEMSNLIISPSTVTVELDKYDSKSFVLKPKIPNITSAEGKTINSSEISCSPAEIIIKGPAAQLANIAECYAVSDKEQTLDASFALNSDRFLLFSQDGKEIDQSLMSFDNPVVSISIPVLTQKTVRLEAQILNAPPDFDTGCLDYTITPDTITIASERPEINLPDPFQIKLLLSWLDIGYSEEFDLDKLLTSKNIKNMSGIQTFKVTLNSDNLASREITLSGSDIHLINKPSDNDYSIVTQRLVVKIVGPKDIINDITAKDITAEVNLVGEDTSMDQFDYNVTVSCNTHKNVWSVGTPKATVKKTAKPDGTAVASVSPAVSTTTG